MGDSACIVRSFSYAPAMPNESKQGNFMLALGDSVSFGRYMNESLSWEKWSTFSQKNYVEEAERYAQPGSVAQKKAFFEAHYKRAAAKKVEQGSAIELEGVVHDNDDARSDVDVGRMEEKVNEDVLEESHQDTVSSSTNPTSKVYQPLPKQDSAKQVLPHHEQHSSSAKSPRKPSVALEDHVTPSKTPIAILEEKINASQVQKMQQQKTKKDQVGNRFRKLSCFFCFKASPTLDEKESEQYTVSALPPPPTSIAKNL